MKHRNKKPKVSNGRALMADIRYRRNGQRLKKLESELKPEHEKERERMEQGELKKEYEKQQTHEGQEALRVKRELARRFSVVLNKPVKVGVISALKDGRTGKTTGYFIAE